MEAQSAPSTRSIHPLLATAAIAVIVASGVGIAAMTGVLPLGAAKPAVPAVVAQIEPAPVVAAAPVVIPAPAPEPAVIAAPEPLPAPKPVAKPKPKPVVVHRAPPVREEPYHIAQAPQFPPPYAGAPPDYRPPLQTLPPPPPPVPVARAICMDCGTVVSMREVVKQGEGTGAGAVAGGVLGAVLGHQVGRGSGRDIGTVVGAAAGAFGGNAIEKNVRTTKRFEIGLRMEDGSTRTIVQDTAPTWRAGDRVRIVNGTLMGNPG